MRRRAPFGRLIPADIDDAVLAADYVADQEADAAAAAESRPDILRLPGPWQRYLDEQDETCDLALRRAYDRAAIAAQKNGRVLVGQRAAGTDGPTGGGHR